MPKQKKSKLPQLVPVLYGAVVVLAILCLALLLALIYNDRPSVGKKSPSISLGSMQYDFSSGKAVKRSDSSVMGLEAFLETTAEHEGCPSQSPVYEHVVSYTKDETQVFLKYGCGAADSPIYAVKTDGTWKTLSPTNHFDSFDIPDCEYLTDYGISKEIGPVCANGIGTEASTYSVR